jgi:hypothetical protein
VVDNAWRLAAKLDQARSELDTRGSGRLELFTMELLVEVSLRYR